MLACLFFSGGRRGELRRLRINHVHLQAGPLRPGRGGRVRAVYLPAVLLTILWAYLDEVRKIEAEDDDDGLGPSTASQPAYL